MTPPILTAPPFVTSTWGRLPPSVLLKPLKSMRQEALTDEMKKRRNWGNRDESMYNVHGIDIW
jgi:hypothetical protein